MTNIDIAIKKAKQSECKFKIAALGFNRNGDCVAKATNLSRFCRKGGGLHAEMRIMAQAKRKGVKTILVCRIGKSGNIRPINPCKTCSNKANDLGIKIISVNGG